MRLHFGKIVAASLTIALVFTLVSCDNFDSSNVSGSDINTGFDRQTAFFRGVWAADDGLYRKGYYIFSDEKNGEYVDAVNGTRMKFSVELNKKKVDFHFDALDEIRAAQVYMTDSGTRTLEWNGEDNKIVMEYWSLIVGADPDNFTFYTAEALTGKAQKAFEEKNGLPAEYVSYFVDVNGFVSIKLESGGKKPVKASYEISSITGTGSDLSNRTAVDFS